MLRAVGVRPLGLRPQTQRRVRIGNTDASEDMGLRPSGAVRRHRPYFARPSY